MKHVAITGKTGYIASSLREYLSRYPARYDVETLDLRNDSWKQEVFSRFDTIVLAAGLAHVRETKQNAALFDAVNRELMVAVAAKAKADGVRQIVFLSSMNVYGLMEGVIDSETEPHPRSAYGRSKWQAEQELTAMADNTFHVAILRPPMVYGENCKGNYQALIRLAKVLPVCPDYYNCRSMISIDRLCTHIRRVIDDGSDGISLPQDQKYGCTCDMLVEIAAKMGRRLPKSKLLNFAPAILHACTKKGRKAFGDLIYVPLPCDTDEEVEVQHD